MASDSGFAVKLLAIEGSKDLLPILLQNNNGPCFIIALANAILLSDNLTKKGNDTRDEDKTVAKFIDFLILKVKKSPSETVELETIYSFFMEKLFNLQNNLDVGEANSIMDILPMLDSGLLINPAFDDIVVSDFGDYSDSIKYIMNQFKLKLYHGFIMPNDLLMDLSNANIKQNFDSCQDYLVSNIDLDDPIAQNIGTFLNDNKTELTTTGCELLLNSIDENQVILFFRNDHFNTCIKNDGTLYILVNDIGYINQPDIVWMPLSILDSGDFFNYDFDLSKIRSHEQLSTDNTDNTDLMLAKQLQLEEDQQISRNLQSQLDNENLAHVSRKSKVPKNTPHKNVNSKLNLDSISKKTPKPVLKPTSRSKATSKSKDSCLIM